MTDTIGSVDFIVSLNGEVIPAQAEAMGKEAGAIASSSFNDSFTKELTKLGKSLQTQFGQIGSRSGNQLGLNLRKAMQPHFAAITSGMQGALDIGHLTAYTSGTGGLLNGMKQLTTGFKSFDDVLGDTNKTVDEGGPKVSRFSSFLSGLHTAINRIGGKGGDLDGFGNGIDEDGKKSDNFLSKWKQLPYGLKQIGLYTALFASLSTQIAVLGSASGSSLAVLGSALSTLAVGIGVFALAAANFSPANIVTNFSKIAPAAQPAAKALEAFYTAFGKIRLVLQGDVFGGLADTIKNLTSTLLPVLQTGLGGIATVINGLLKALGGALTSQSGLTTIATILDGMQPVLAALGQAAISFGSAIGTIFVASLPNLLSFAGTIQQIALEFSNFLKSTAGQNALFTFFEDGKEVISAVIPLVGAAGKLLASLVTPESIKNLVLFLGNIQAFLPALGGLLTVIGNVNVLGLVGQALAEIGAVITPLLPSLEQLGTLVGNLLSSALSALEPVAAGVAAALLPLVGVASDLITALEPLIPAVLPIIQALGTGLVSVITAVMPLFTALVPAVTEIVSALTPLGTLLTGAINQAFAAILPVISALVPVIASLIPPIAQLISALIPPLVDLFNLLWPVILQLINALLPLLPPLLSILTPLLQLVTTILPPLVSLLGPILTPVVQTLGAVFGILGPILKGAADLLSDILVPAVNLITKVLGDLIAFITDVFQGKWGAAWKDIQKLGVDAFQGLATLGVSIVNGLVDLINGLTKGINSVTKDVGIPAIPAIPHIPTPHFAAGGILYGPTSIVGGENGAEAIVPLDRPVNQVDPSVRALAAFAQGLGKPNNDGANVIAMPGRTVTIEAGAIQVNEVTDGSATGEQVLDRLVAKLP